MSGIHVNLLKQVGRMLSQPLARETLEQNNVQTDLAENQIKNLVAKVRKEDIPVPKGTGYVTALMQRLDRLKTHDAEWQHNVRVNETTTCLEAVFWMSPNQIRLARRSWKVVINDVPFKINKYGFPPQLVLCRGQQQHHENNRSLPHSESAVTHVWMLPCYQEAVLTLPRMLVTDQDIALKLAVAELQRSHDIFHRFCKRHLHGVYLTTYEKS